MERVKHILQFLKILDAEGKLSVRKLLLYFLCITVVYQVLVHGAINENTFGAVLLSIFANF